MEGGFKRWTTSIITSQQLWFYVTCFSGTIVADKSIFMQALGQWTAPSGQQSNSIGVKRSAECNGFTGELSSRFWTIKQVWNARNGILQVYFSPAWTALSMVPGQKNRSHSIKWSAKRLQSGASNLGWDFDRLLDLDIFLYAVHSFFL